MTGALFSYVLSIIIIGKLSLFAQSNCLKILMMATLKNKNVNRYLCTEKLTVIHR